MDGKTLCLLCTINYKKALFKKKSNEQKASSQAPKSRQQSKHRDKKLEDNE